MDLFGNAKGVGIEAIGNNTRNVFAKDLIRLKGNVRRREGRRISDEKVAIGLTEGGSKQTCKNLSSAQ